MVPYLTDCAPIGRSGTSDLNWPDHDQADLLPTPPLRNLAGSARSPLPDQPRLPQRFFIVADQAEMPNRDISQEILVLGNLEQAISEGFWFLSGLACSDFRRSKWSRPMQIASPRSSFSLRFGGPIAPPQSYFPIAAPIRASKQRPNRGGTTK